jgi:hypothetical protein
MNKRLSLVLLLLAVLAGAWALRGSRAPNPSESAAVPPRMAVRLSQPESSVAPPQDVRDSAAAEAESLASDRSALYQQDPALLDVLEDVDSPDPAVSDDARAYLESQGMSREDFPER